MSKRTTTVAQYLASLPPDRREAMEAVRQVILDNLDPSFEEGIQYGAIGYFVPHSVYPPGYHCDPKQPLPFAGIASQKRHMGVYLFCLYTSAKEEQRFREEWRQTGKQLDMGKSCVRFKKLDDVPLKVLGKAIKRMKIKKFIASYEAGISRTRSGSKKKTAKKK